jgi:hypothetical protein
MVALAELNLGRDNIFMDTPAQITNQPSGGPAHGLPRRRFFDDMPDKGLFALVAVVGFLSIVGLKYRNYNPDLVTAFAVSLMVIYGLVAYRIPAVKLRADRLGDNFYYLGFIYTLASLSVALMQLRDGADIQPILASFGIALFTTIVGVSGRVVFVQMRGEIDEIEEQSRKDLLQTSKELQAQLAQALRDFETFTTAVRQTAEETASQSGVSAQKQIELIAKVANSAVDEIKSAFDANKSSARELASVVRDISGTLSQITERLGKVELPTQKFEQQLATFGNQLHALLAQLSTAVDAISTRQRWYWPFR